MTTVVASSASSTSAVQGDPFLERTWREIEPSVYIILGDDKNSPLDSRMYTQTYSKVYNYCTTASSKRAPSVNKDRDGKGTVKLVGAELYYKLQEYLKYYLENLRQKETETFLQFYIRNWQRYLIGSTRLNDVLDYINRYWVAKERADGHREIYDILSLCLLSWRDYKFHANLPTLINEVMEQIRLQRESKIDSVGNLSVAIKSFVLLGFDVNDLKKQNLSVYINDFEKAFLTETYNFYTEESDRYIHEHGVVNYLVKAQQRIDEELKRLEELNDHTRRPLNDVLNQVLITNHADEIRAELTPLLDQERYADVSRMNHLLRRVPMTVEPLLQDLQSYVKQQGLNAVQQLSEELQASSVPGEDPHHRLHHIRHSKKGETVDAKSYIKALLSVYFKFRDVVEGAFDNNESFVKALDSACQSFINTNPIATPTPRSKSRTPDLLAKYSDELLRKKDVAENMSVDELMTLFKFVDDKESFEVWYRRYLSKRLMGGTMSPEDEEREEVIIQRLKTANSIEYTTKITNMFNDIRVSRELGSVYREAISDSTGGAKGYISDLEPRILDSSSWNAIFRGSNESFILPKELISTQEKFQFIYQERYSGRQLNWIWNRSRIELKINNLSRPGKPPYHFTVTLFQYALLSPFNDNDTMSAYQLLELTALPSEVFKASMIPLVKNKLLIQNPAGDEHMTNPTTQYTIVKEYTSKRIKVNFAAGVRMVDTRNEDRETNEEVERRHHELLKACIVRIMKARKECKHERLTNEVYQIIDRFKPTVSDIKRAIEVLIDEQYLARGDDGSTYVYLS
ncbi:DEKNAAC105054 [Brettanomyces naardenensis]|uniref:DEKNAAC105054 n=1 Tax=Brettanomyces naardenensis TaxID=13370 RepID=A0A448YSI1_BRENA|nr:DEKNAAC105054 [Brettanomyces naardenensis]